MYTKIRNLVALLAISCSQEIVAQTTYTWGPAGPILTAGRARNMVVDKDNSNLLYVGSSTSGIFKSTDGGANWAPVNDQDSIRNISYMAQAIDGTIYAGTGEGFLRYGQKTKAQPGRGLFKLVNNQLVMVADAAVTGTVINRIAVHPTNAQIIALATNLGVLLSSDGGQNFTLAAITPTNVQLANVSYGMDVKFDNSGNLYCTVGNERGGHIVPGPNFNNIHSKIFKSDDNAYSAFTEITPTVGLVGAANYGRIELAIAPSDNNVIYASCANKNISTTLTSYPSSASLKALYVSVNGGQDWETVLQGAAQLDPLTNGGSIATGDYAHVLLVHPTNPHMLFIGGYKFFVYSATSSNPAGGTFVQAGNYFAFNTPLYLKENIHDIRIVPGNPTKFYFITDAGIYRSTDLISTNQGFPPTFQPYFKGLITGQFNSVSMQSQPLSVTSNDSVHPHFGYIGGTGANGLVYFSGTQSLVSQESNYVGGEIYNAEISKILPDAAFFSSGTGQMYRTTDYRSSQPAAMQVNVYTGSLSAIKSDPVALSNANTTTGTPFRLWEYYGQVPVQPDSAMFYNDSVRVITSMEGGVPVLTSSKTFTFSGTLKRPNKFAKLDSIIIRTGTLEIAANPIRIPTAFTNADKKQITIKIGSNPVPTSTVAVPVPGGTVIHTVQVYQGGDLGLTGPVDSTALPTVSMNLTTEFDDIVVTFSAPPFANKTTTYANIPDPALYYKVFATVFYRYDVNDTIVIRDENISTKPAEYTVVLEKEMRWAYGDTPSRFGAGNTVVPFAPYNKPVLVPMARSARLAMCVNNSATGNQNAVVVSKTPLNLNDPLSFVRVSQSGTRTDDASGMPTNSVITILGKPNLLEWSKSGTELYFATSNFGNHYLYRVSHITRIMDFSARSSEGGKFHTDVFNYGTGIQSGGPNNNSPYRTTLIGTFGKPITSINVNNDGSQVIVTLNGASTGTTAGTVYKTTLDARVANSVSQVWERIDNDYSGLAGKRTYCSLREMADTLFMIGTDDGIVYTRDIYQSPVNWESTVNQSGAGSLPRVQVFDIEQQTLPSDNAYNFGEILVATNGRGVWSNRANHAYYVVGVEEFEQIEKAPVNSLSLFPNPSSGLVNLSFTALSGERATLQIMDLSGRAVIAEELGRLGEGEYTHIFDAKQLNSGIYIVNVSSDSGVRRVSKLVISR